MKIVFLGDSLTYGYGVRRNVAWINLLNETGDFEAINKGINGDTTGGMLSRFQSDVKDLKPSIVHIMGGANDVICNATEDDLKPNIMAMVHQAHAYGIKPIVGIAPSGLGGKICDEWSNFTDFKRVSEVLLRYREWLFKFCKAFGADYIDYHAKINEYMDKKNIESLFFDGLHFSEEGNKLMADIFLDYMRANKHTA